MNLKLIILEDQNTELQQLCSYLHEWSDQTSTPVQIDTYLSGEAFFQQYRREELTTTAAFFLDIQMGDLSGLDVAKRLRQEHYHGNILFLTAFREYVFQGYDVHALNYLLKPIQREPLFLCLDEIADSVRKLSYLYRDKQNIIRIPYQEILCFSSRLHYIDILTSNHCFVQYATLKQVIVNLPKEFIQVHRSYIVNLAHIDKIAGSVIYLSNDKTVPIGRSYYHPVCETFSDYVLRFDGHGGAYDRIYF